jgi:hypothetical protein
MFLLVGQPGHRVAVVKREWTGLQLRHSIDNPKRELRREEIFLFGFAVTH